MSTLLVSHVSLRHNFLCSEQLNLGPVSLRVTASSHSQKRETLPISCKLSPAVAGAGGHGTESRVGWRLNVQCREKRRGGGNVAMAVGVQKGNTGDGRDQAGVLDEGLGDVWPRPGEVSNAKPSYEKVTPG